MNKSQYVVYSKSTGVKIGTGEKRSDARGSKGHFLRFLATAQSWI